MASNTWTSRPDLDLPYGVAFGASVDYGDGFLAVGGYRLNTDGFGESEKIWRFSAGTFEWSELPATLAVPRTELTAFMVPDEIVQC